jgi:hypothetical protein
MAKVTGLGWTTLSLDDAGGTPRDIRNDVTNFDFSTPYASQEVTGVDKSAMERLALLADFSGTLNGVFNPSANLSHAVLSGDLRVARTLSLTVSGKSLPNEVLIGEYGLTRAAGGEFTWQAPFSLSDGTTPTWS